MKTVFGWLWLFIATCLYGCGSSPAETKAEQLSAMADSNTVNTIDTSKKALIIITDTLPLPEVPVLCYHQIRPYKASDGPLSKLYTVTPTAFAAQMKALYDSGYHPILPENLYLYLQRKAALPENPVIITFDDGTIGQYTAALPELNKYNFKAVFFIMTVSLNRPGYLSSEQLKILFKDGHAIESHTWDHHNVKKYDAADWELQLDKPAAQLEAITGKKCEYFAYPFGEWSKEAIRQLKTRNYKLGFILATAKDDQDPLFTVRRIIVKDSWAAKGLITAMRTSFH